MKKVLIYKDVSQLAPKGGPAGYLYNLREGLHGIADPSLEIVFLDLGNAAAGKKRRTGIKFLDEIAGGFYHRRLYGNVMNDAKPHVDGRTDFNQYDVVHFHSPYELYRVRDSLKDYCGKVLLTCHTPVPYYQEVISKFTKTDMRIMGSVARNLSVIDKWAFERADYLVFPCRYADESYLKLWPEYKNIRPLKEYKYILTGIKPCVAKIGKDEIRRKYGIPDDAFVFSYVGRHNEVKGYNDLKELASKVLEENPNARFLIAGKEEPLTRLNHDRWIEVGWTNDPHSIIAASDVFVLPNKETYFDLVLLEVLSLGVPVMATRTGGNKLFGDIEAVGVALYDNPDQGYNTALRFMNLDKKTLHDLGHENFLLYSNQFSLEQFTKNYIRLYQEVLQQT